MSTLTNKTTTITNGPEILNYAGLIKIVLGNATATGVTINSMRERFKLIDKIESMEQELEITLEELKVIQHAVSTFTWAIIHKDIITFGEYIEQLK